MASESPSGRRRLLYVLLTLVIAVSAGARFADLASSPDYVFDERYNAHDAAALLHGELGPRGREPWRPGVALSFPHPELGIVLIAAGVAVIGDDPWGWRVAAAVAGTLLIALVFPLARRLSLAPEWALAATVLAASDAMLVVQSRTAMLDIFVALWSAACIYCGLRAVQSVRQSRWIVLCGLAGGAAVATKWSGGLAVLLILALLRRRKGTRAAVQGVAVSGIVLATYFAAYAPYFIAGHTLPQWLHYQSYMVSFNWGGERCRALRRHWGSPGSYSWSRVYSVSPAPARARRARCPQRWCAAGRSSPGLRSSLQRPCPHTRRRTAERR